MSDWIAVLRERIRLPDIVGDHTKLRVTGRTMRGPCPLHGGEGPNFSVDPAKGYFKCFVCGAGGDVFDYLRLKNGWDFMTSAKTLAERYGVEVPRRRTRTLDEEERARAEAQSGFSGSSAKDFWAQWGVETSVPLFHLGMREGSTPCALVPLWDESDQGVPGGWLSYQMDSEGRPVPQGLDPLSREELQNVLFLPSGAAYAARENVLLFVPDPIVAIRLYEAGYHAVFSVANPTRGPQESWLSSDLLRQLKDRLRAPIPAIGLLVPHTSPSAELRAEHLRALYATEPHILSAGAEALLIRIPEVDSSEEPFGWEWARQSDQEQVEDALDHVEWVQDLYEMRVRALLPHLKRGNLTAEAAMEKLHPSLQAVYRSSPMLYEVYLAWAVALLELDPFALRRSIEISGGSEAGEVF